jgi:predicted RNase H-like HicB family nuclease
MADYIALVHKDADSGFGVSFPDLPGVITVADTMEELRREAEEALALHLEGMVEDGSPIPVPSSLDDIVAGPDYKDAVAVVLIHAAETDTPSVRVNITMPEAMLRLIDRHAADHGYTRSGFLVHAAKKVLASAAPSDGA